MKPNKLTDDEILRHEEKVAKLAADNPQHRVYSIGIGQELMAILDDAVCTTHLTIKELREKKQLQAEDRLTRHHVDENGKRTVFYLLYRDKHYIDVGTIKDMEDIGCAEEIRRLEKEFPDGSE